MIESFLFFVVFVFFIKQMWKQNIKNEKIKIMQDTIASGSRDPKTMQKYLEAKKTIEKLIATSIVVLILLLLLTIFG